MVEVGRRRDEALDVGRVKEGFFAARLCKGTEGHDWRGLWGSVKGFCLVRFYKLLEEFEHFILCKKGASSY